MDVDGVRQDVRERFAYLFRPATDLAASLAVDIVNVLKEYDEHTLENSNGGLNFADAAMIISGTTGVYCRKVDALHREVMTFADELNRGPVGGAGRRQRGADDEKSSEGTTALSEAGREPNLRTKPSRLQPVEGNDGQQPCTAFGPTSIKAYNAERAALRILDPAALDQHGMLERSMGDGLSIFDRFHVDRSTHHLQFHVCNQPEYQPLFIMPGNMMPLQNNEKRPVAVFGLHGKFGDVDDYRTCRDLLIHKNSFYANRGGRFSYAPDESNDPCNFITRCIRDFLSMIPQTTCAAESRAPSALMQSCDVVEFCRRMSEGGFNIPLIISRLSQSARPSTVLQHNSFTTQSPPPEAGNFYGQLNDPGHADFDDGPAPIGDIGVEAEDNVLNSLREYLISNSSTSQVIEPRRTRSRGLRRSAHTEDHTSRHVAFESIDFWTDKRLDEYEVVAWKNKPFEPIRSVTRLPSEIQRRRNGRLKRQGTLASIEQGVQNVLLPQRIVPFIDAITFGHRKLAIQAYVSGFVDVRELAEIEIKAREKEESRLQKAEDRRQRLLRLIEARKHQHQQRTLATVVEEQEGEAEGDGALRPVDKENQEPAQANGKSDVAQLTPVDTKQSNNLPLADAEDDYFDPEPLHAFPIDESLGAFMDDNRHDFETLNYMAGGDLDTSVAHHSISHLQLVEAMDIDGPPVSQPKQTGMQGFPADWQHILTMGGSSSVSNIVQLFIARKWDVALARAPEMRKKLNTWENKMEGVLGAMTDDFEANVYGRRILESFEGQVGREVNFCQIANQSPKEKARYFLSSLMLVNQGTIRVCADTGMVSSDFPVKLLKDASWYGDRFAT